MEFIYSVEDKNLYEKFRQEKNVQKANACTKKVLEFYEKNKEKCEQALTNADSVEKNESDFFEYKGDIESVDFKILLGNSPKILVFTANNIENKILVWSLHNKTKAKLSRYTIDDRDKNLCINVNLCTYSGYNIIHHHVGKTGDEYTRRAINDITQFITPDYIILLGICYGLNLKKQEIGLVNISEQITGVRINFRDKPNSEEIIFEPDIEFEEVPNSFLFKTISTKINSMKITEIDSDVKVRYMYGRIISANSLMSCKTVKESIVSSLQNGAKGRNYIGGEMEACGIFKANINSTCVNFDNWIVIKAICDWGESKNFLVPNEEKSEHIKDCLQAYAMMNSCAVFEFLLRTNSFRHIT